jgi:hypothetical protein
MRNGNQVQTGTRMFQRTGTNTCQPKKSKAAKESKTKKTHCHHRDEESKTLIQHSMGTATSSRVPERLSELRGDSVA